MYEFIFSTFTIERINTVLKYNSQQFSFNNDDDGSIRIKTKSHLRFTQLLICMN